MDSATQFILGAAVAQAVLRSNAEQKNHRWWRFWLGGLLGTLPDLDVFCTAWMDGPTALGFHRGLTHSIFCCTLITPLLAWLCLKWFNDQPNSWRDWNWCVWLGLNTHWMIDCLTQYGTQVFLPFSDYPVNISSVFIIDPLYTGILACGLASSIRHSSLRAIRAGLGLSTGYLALTLASKMLVLDRLEKSLAAQGFQPCQVISVPTPFNSLLWYGYADLGDEVLVADSSLLDQPNRLVAWQRIPKNSQALPHLGEGPAEKRLLWFSRGFYRVELLGNQPIWIDLRFGRLASWLQPIQPEGEDHIFRFALEPNNPHGPYEDFHRLTPKGGLELFPWTLFARRILGQPAQ